ncbi:MAG: ribosome small subunit-dependent GTPase A [Spirochaetales bacterium]|nr:ribosome small subunit-dependent GTPase A [Spirochaetales bacterium]
MAKGIIWWGINNIFGVETNGLQTECRLKGKVLKDAEQEYNPLAPGDLVEWEASDSGRGLISARLPRKNAYQRWNKKRRQPQTIAANLDLLLLVTTTQSPPFRPRFLDRALVMAEKENLPVKIVVNKIDLGLDGEIEDRLAGYQDLGCEVALCSSLTSEGIEDLQVSLYGKTAALVGQSGVGKSSLLNRLVPGAHQRVGELSAKYDRGNHTTNFALLYAWDGRTGGIIDTPGVREFEVFGIAPASLSAHFPDFEPFQGKCTFNRCTHRVEPGCAIRAAVENGLIEPDRWDTYLKIYEDLLVAEKTWM